MLTSEAALSYAIYQKNVQTDEPFRLPNRQWISGGNTGRSVGQSCEIVRSIPQAWTFSQVLNRVVVLPGNPDRVYTPGCNLFGAWGIAHAFSHTGTNLWEDIIAVTTMWYGMNQPNFGDLTAPGCTDLGAQPTVFFVTSYNGSPTDTSQLIRIADQYPTQSRGIGYWMQTLPDAEWQPIGPVYITRPGSGSHVYVLTRTGYFLLCDPGGDVPEEFPVNLNLGVASNDLVVDADGAILLGTYGGQLRAYWGK